LQLIQQISTFAINYQGRPFRENLSENRGMYLGILGVSALAFSCSTEFIPELNEQMKLVPFTSDFKVRMTATMLVDYVGCYVIEKGLKWGFSDYRPKDIAIRRPEQIAKEEARKVIEAVEAKKKKAEDAARKEKETIEKAEKAMADLRARWSRQ
jgi:cation-transporting ATPase 13A1